MEETLSPSEFISYLNQSSATSGTSQKALYDYAYKLHKADKINDAIEAYSAVIKSDSKNVDAYVNLAICYASKNDYQNAEKILLQAKSLFPTNNLVLKTLQNVQKDNVSTILVEASKSYENKDYKNAIKLYSSINPATEDSLLGIAASYQSLNNFDEAINYYKKAMEISSKNAEIPYYIGYLYSEQQKWKDAESFLKKSISLVLALMMIFSMTSLSFASETRCPGLSSILGSLSNLVLGATYTSHPIIGFTPSFLHAL